MSELVSIITPVYNAEKYLEDTILSVLNQEYKNWELILVDDCSKDGSRDIIKKYAQLYSNIKSIFLSQNKGVSNARNIGVENAKGEYIAFLDSDDIWRQNKLSLQIPYMKNNNYDFTFTYYSLMDNNGCAMDKEIKYSEPLDYKKMLSGNKIGCLTVILKKKLLEDIKFLSIGHEDYIVWLSILKKGVKAYPLKENLAIYRKSDNSLSSNKLKAAKWTWGIYRKIEKLSVILSMYYFVLYSINGYRKS